MQKKEEHMGKHKALQGAIAAFASVATLGALAVPALADSASTYSPNGKSVAELAQHGGAQRIAAIGNKSAKNVVLFIGDGMGDSEITVARNYLKGVNGHFDGLDAVGQPGALGLATTTDQQKALSDNAEVKVATENGSYAADAMGFNGDAVLSYELKDKSGNVIAASDSTTPLSGVRVKTAQTTAIAPDKVAEGNEYTLTVTGRQSGKSVTVDFQAPAAGSSDKSADKNADKNGVIASGKVNNNPKVDGSPLGETGTAVAVVAIAVAMLAAIAMIIKTVKITR